MELAIATPKGNKGTVEVSEAAFGIEFNQDLVHQAVVAFLAGARQGTRAQKNRKTGQLFLVVAASRSLRKELVVRVPVLSADRFGAVVVLHLLRSLKIIARN